MFKIKENKKENDDVLMVELEEHDCGVDIKVIDNEGCDHYIALLDNNGTLYKYDDLEDIPGIKINKKGEIKVSR